MKQTGILFLLLMVAACVAKGGKLPAQQDSISTDTVTVAAAATQGSSPYQIQLGAFTTAEDVKSNADTWIARGLTNVIHMENPNATTEYRYVVRLTGFQGYAAALAESKKINSQYGIGSYPIQVRP